MEAGLQWNLKIGGEKGFEPQTPALRKIQSIFIYVLCYAAFVPCLGLISPIVFFDFTIAQYKS